MTDRWWVVDGTGFSLTVRSYGPRYRSVALELGNRVDLALGVEQDDGAGRALLERVSRPGRRW